MKKINTLTMMILLTYSFSIAQELEVEGDLIVTGIIESATIDSMQAVIDSLEAEMASMHADNQLETRVYEINISMLEQEYQDFSLSEITNGELDNNQNAILTILSVSDILIDNNDQSYLYINYEFGESTFAVFYEGYHNTTTYKNYFGGMQHQWKVGTGNLNATMQLAITAQFSD
jgi:hypothetical protein